MELIAKRKRKKQLGSPGSRCEYMLKRFYWNVIGICRLDSST